MSEVRSPSDDHILITVEEGVFVAEDPETGVASQGESRSAALANLAEAIELHESPVSEETLEGVDPSDAPWL